MKRRLKKMKAFQLIQIMVIAASVVGCSPERDIDTKRSQQTNEKAIFKSQKKEYTDSTFKYSDYDSAQFRIQYKYFLHHGGLFAIHKIDTVQKIDSISYFKNNVLSWKELRTYPNGINIGKWYQTNSKKPFVNYDDSLVVNYWKAIHLARKRGYVFPEIEVTMIMDPERSFWGFYRVNDAQEPQSLLIDTKTGVCREIKLNLKTNQ